MVARSLWITSLLGLMLSMQGCGSKKKESTESMTCEKYDNCAVPLKNASATECTSTGTKTSCDELCCASACDDTVECVPSKFVNKDKHCHEATCDKETDAKGCCDDRGKCDDETKKHGGHPIVQCADLDTHVLDPTSYCATGNCTPSDNATCCVERASCDQAGTDKKPIVTCKTEDFLDKENKCKEDQCTQDDATNAKKPKESCCQPRALCSEKVGDWDPAKQGVCKDQYLDKAKRCKTNKCTTDDCCFDYAKCTTLPEDACTEEQQRKPDGTCESDKCNPATDNAECCVGLECSKSKFHDGDAPKGTKHEDFPWYCGKGKVVLPSRYCGTLECNSDAEGDKKQCCGTTCGPNYQCHDPNQTPKDAGTICTSVPCTPADCCKDKKPSHTALFI